MASRAFAHPKANADTWQGQQCLGSGSKLHQVNASWILPPLQLNSLQMTCQQNWLQIFSSSLQILAAAGPSSHPWRWHLSQQATVSRLLAPPAQSKLPRIFIGQHPDIAECKISLCLAAMDVPDIYRKLKHPVKEPSASSETSAAIWHA